MDFLLPRLPMLLLALQHNATISNDARKYVCISFKNKQKQKNNRIFVFVFEKNTLQTLMDAVHNVIFVVRSKFCCVPNTTKCMLKRGLNSTLFTKYMRQRGLSSTLSSVKLTLQNVVCKDGHGQMRTHSYKTSFFLSGIDIKKM